MTVHIPHITITENAKAQTLGGGDWNGFSSLDAIQIRSIDTMEKETDPIRQMRNQETLNREKYSAYRQTKTAAEKYDAYAIKKNCA